MADPKADPAVWALNRLRDVAPEALEELAVVHRGLSKELRLRTLTSRRRDVVGELASAANGILRAAGHDPAEHGGVIVATLREAVTSRETLARILEGTLCSTVKSTA